MTPLIAAIVLMVLGLLLAALVAFAWPTLSRLLVHRLRSHIFGSATARGMTIVGALLMAAIGLFLLISNP